MLGRRRSVALVTLALATLGLLAFAGRADAAGTCTLAPPARIAIYQTQTRIAADITGDCVPEGEADWYAPSAVGRYAEAHFYTYGGPTTDSFILVPDRLDHYGLLAWQPGGAVSSVFCGEGPDRPPCLEITQNQPSTDIRLGGYASLSGTRSGSRITFTAGSGGWSPYTHRLVPRPRVGGEIQTQYADGTWHRVGNSFTTGANAKATVTATIAATRTFRYAMYSTATYVDRASNPIVR